MNQTMLQARLQEAFAALRAGQLAVARTHADALLAELPANTDVLYLAGEVACAEGRESEAIDLFHSAAEHAAVTWPLHLRLAELLLFLRRRDDARDAIRAACKVAGDQPEAWSMAGKAWNKCGETALARDCFRRVTELRSEDPGNWFELAGTQFFLGETESAGHSLEQVMRRTGQDGPLAGHARYLRATLRTQAIDSNHVETLQRDLAAGFHEPEGRSATCHALAKELEDLGLTQASERALVEGAALRKSILRPDVSGEVDTMQAIAAAWSGDACATSVPAADGEGPIFIVGLPRTGTTLTERILMRDPRVAAAGELLDLPQLVGQAASRIANQFPALSLPVASTRLDFEALGREYLRGALEAAHGSAIFIDKLPVNFLYLGIIARALPQARIVHLVRDPMDAAWAIHKTLFASAYHWSCDLDQVARYIIAYRDLMQHWDAVLPGRILDVRYEDLVHDPDTQSQRLLDWCELQPASDEATVDRPVVTASAAQVRQPIHARSVGRWHDHADLLAGVEARFRTAGLID